MLMLQFDLGCLATSRLDFCPFQQQVPHISLLEWVDCDTAENIFKLVVRPNSLYTFISFDQFHFVTLLILVVWKFCYSHVTSSGLLLDSYCVAEFSLPSNRQSPNFQRSLLKGLWQLTSSELSRLSGGQKWQIIRTVQRRIVYQYHNYCTPS